MPLRKPKSACRTLDACAQNGPDMARLAPTGWVFLGGARTLCLPRVASGQRALLDYSLRFFTQPGWRRWIYRMCLMPGLCRLAHLSAAHGEGRALHQIFGGDWPGWQRLSGRFPLYLAARYGSPGPYQKLSALLVDAAGKGVAFVKLALSAQASEMVGREKSWLERLNSIAELRGSVPAVLQAGQAGNGQAYLMSTISPDLGASRRFGEPHARFLSALGRHTARPAAFGEGMEAAFLSDALQRLAAILGPDLHAELGAAWTEAAGKLGTWHGPLVLAHRDFVPWNMYEGGGRLFVFDWEYAADRASPLHDFFHFHLMPVAASRWRRVRADRSRALVDKGLAYARRQYPDSKWTGDVISAWLVIYLLDVVLFYTDSRKAFNPKRPVLAAYTDMIRNRDRWWVR